MITDSRKELLMSYVKANVAPILVDFIEGEMLQNSVILPANCSKEELIGHYEGKEYVAPKWLQEILSENNAKILVINKIDSIPKEEQIKFVELLKYRKISTFDLPKHTLIMVTAKEINEESINEEIYSLVAHIVE